MEMRTQHQSSAFCLEGTLTWVAAELMSLFRTLEEPSLSACGSLSCKRQVAAPHVCTSAELCPLLCPTKLL